MKYAFVTPSFVIANAERTKFFAFGGKHSVRHSDTVTSPVIAEQFFTPEAAAAVIDQGKEGKWGTITSDELFEIVPINLSAVIEMPGPVPVAKDLPPEDTDTLLEVAQIALEDPYIREQVMDKMDLEDSELARLRGNLTVYLNGMAETVLADLAEDTVEQDTV